MYDPTLGVWLQRDPLPQETGNYADGPNLYQYVGSRPTSAIDPSGLGMELHNGTRINPNGTIVEGSGEPDNTYSWSESQRRRSQREMNIEIIRRNAENESAAHPSQPVVTKVPIIDSNEHITIVYRNGKPSLSEFRAL